MSTPPAERPTTPDELLAGVKRLSARLGRHLDSLEAGDVSAVDDVATILRTLVTPGRGNGVLKRLRKTFSVDSPLIYISARPVDQPRLVLAIGSIPYTPTDYDRDDASPGSWVSVEDWAERPVLIVRGATRRVNTWSRLIATYANNHGSHLGTSVPQILSETSSTYADQLDLGEFLMHCAGVVAEDAIDQALATIAGDRLVVPNRNRRLLTPLVALSVRDGNTPMGDVEFRAGLAKGQDGTDVLKLKGVAGTRFMKIGLLPGELDNGDAGQQLVVDWSEVQPAWWPTK